MKREEALAAFLNGAKDVRVAWVDIVVVAHLPPWYSRQTLNFPNNFRFHLMYEGFLVYTGEAGIFTRQFYNVDKIIFQLFSLHTCRYLLIYHCIINVFNGHKMPESVGKSTRETNKRRYVRDVDGISPGARAIEFFGTFAGNPSLSLSLSVSFSCFVMQILFALRLR